MSVLITEPFAYPQFFTGDTDKWPPGVYVSNAWQNLVITKSDGLALVWDKQESKMLPDRITTTSYLWTRLPVGTKVQIALNLEVT